MNKTKTTDKSKTEAAQLRRMAQVAVTGVSAKYADNAVVVVYFASQGSGLVAERERSATIYEAASKMELASRGNRWAISPRAYDGVIRIECMNDAECEQAAEMVAAVVGVKAVR